VEDTLFDFMEAKLPVCNEIVDYFGVGDPEDIFGYFLRGVREFDVNGFNRCHAWGERDWWRDAEIQSLMLRNEFLKHLIKNHHQ